MDLPQYLEQGRRIVDRELENRLPSDQALPPSLVEAMRYSLLGGGKRIRPILVLAVSELFRTGRRTVIPIACAVEMVHTCSLILDDLPCMDNAAVRRGKPSNHIRFGEAVAILAAVGLLNQAFHLLQDRKLREALRKGNTHPGLAEKMAEAVGPDGMISGQVADLEGSAGRQTLERLEYVHSRKTGSLFIAGAEMAAIAGGASEKEILALRTYAKNLGLAFQITDDLLDSLGSARRIGKPVRQDRGKFTFVNLCGSEGSRRLVEELIEVSKQALKPLRARGKRLIEFADFVRTRDR